jgi:hypothetical protein
LQIRPGIVVQCIIIARDVRAIAAQRPRCNGVADFFHIARENRHEFRHADF